MISLIRRISEGARAPSRFAATCAALCAGVTPVHAQEPMHLTSRSACIHRIAIDTLFRFGGPDDPAPIGMTGNVAHTAADQYILSNQYFLTAIHVYDSRGSYVRSIGRRGRGPGEFEYAGSLDLLPDDSVLVFDSRLLRWSVFTPGFRYVRSVAMPISSWGESSVVPGTGVLFNGQIPTRESAGYPLHLVDPDGHLVRSFGSSDPILSRKDPDLHSRVTAQAQHGQVCLGYRSRYTLERWSLGGSKTAEIERVVEWFKPQEGSRRVSMTAPPIPRLNVIHEDSTGLVWTVVSVADSRWKQVVSTRGRIQGQFPVLSYSDPDLYFDSVLEVIDPRTGQCIASTRFDQEVHDFIDDGSLVIYSIDDDGNPSVSVWRPRIQFNPTPTDRRY